MGDEDVVVLVECGVCGEDYDWVYDWSCDEECYGFGWGEVVYYEFVCEGYVVVFVYWD